MFVKPASAYSFLRFCLQTFALISYKEWWLLIFPELDIFQFNLLQLFLRMSFLLLPIVSDSFPDCFYVSASCSITTFPLPVSGFWCFVNFFQWLTRSISKINFLSIVSLTLISSWFLFYVSFRFHGLLKFSDCSVHFSSFWLSVRDFYSAFPKNYWLLTFTDCSVPVSSFWYTAFDFYLPGFRRYLITFEYLKLLLNILIFGRFST